MKRNLSDHVNRGFTLVELLVVIAIIGILIGMLLPAVQQVREASRRSACANKEKQAALAVLNYESAFKVYPVGQDMPFPGTVGGVTNTQYTWGWAARILPQMEQSSLYDQMDLKKSLADGASGNAVRAGAVMQIYICPSSPNPAFQVECCSGFSNGPRPTDDIGGSSYAGCHGSNTLFLNGGSGPRGNPDGNGVFTNHRTVKMGEISDGTSNTLMLGETTEVEGMAPQGPATFGFMWANWGVQSTLPGINGPFTIPGGRDPGSNPIPSGGQNRHDQLFREVGFSSYHPGGANFAFNDGSVHLITESIAQTVFDTLGTRDFGEVIGDY